MVLSRRTFGHYVGSDESRSWFMKDLLVILALESVCKQECSCERSCHVWPQTSAIHLILQSRAYEKRVYRRARTARIAVGGFTIT